MSRLSGFARFLAVSVLPAVLAAGCATNPVTGQTELSVLSEQQEIRIGAQQYLHSQQSAGGRFILDPALAAYVNEVGRKLVKVSDRPNLPYEFVIINDSVPNAWALPGGKLATAVWPSLVTRIPWGRWRENLWAAAAPIGAAALPAPVSSTRL